MSVTRFSMIFILILAGLVFTQDRDQIIFSHAFHIEDVEVECSVCHGEVSESTSLSESLLPTMDTCSDCHDIEDDCSLCHSNEDEPESYEKQGSTSGEEFSHAFHLVKFSDCGKCHQDTIEDDGEEPRRIWAESNCRSCHEQNKPDSHDLSWYNYHGMEVNFPVSASCSMCHRETFCDDCHNKQQFIPNIHPPTFLLQHGFEARMEIVECQTCHSIDNDCRLCHSQQQIMPIDHNMGNWTLLTAGGLHSESAEDSPELCRVCHTTNSCQRAGCHNGGF